MALRMVTPNTRVLTAGHSLSAARRYALLKSIKVPEWSAHAQNGRLYCDFVTAFYNSAELRYARPLLRVDGVAGVREGRDGGQTPRLNGEFSKRKKSLCALASLKGNTKLKKYYRYANECEHVRGRKINFRAFFGMGIMKSCWRSVREKLVSFFLSILEYDLFLLKISVWLCDIANFLMHRNETLFFLMFNAKLSFI